MRFHGNRTLVVTLALVAWGAAITPTPVAAQDTAKPPMALKFGARTDAAPLSSRQGDRWTGYSLDLCRLIYDRYHRDYRALHPEAGLPAKPRDFAFIPVAAAERIDALVHGRIDVLCGATTVTVSRMQRVDFTLLTFVSGTGIMKKAQTDSTLLRNPGRKKGRNPRIVYVGCVEDRHYEDCTTTEDWVANRFGSAVEQLPKKTHMEAFDALRSGEADFYVGDRVILANTLDGLKNRDEYVLAPTFLTFEPYAIAIAKGNERLRTVANAVLAELYRRGDQEGGIDGIYRNYFKSEKSDLLKAMYRLQAFPE